MSYAPHNASASTRDLPPALLGAHSTAPRREDINIAFGRFVKYAEVGVPASRRGGMMSWADPDVSEVCLWRPFCGGEPIWMTGWLAGARGPPSASAPPARNGGSASTGERISSSCGMREAAEPARWTHEEVEAERH